MELDRTELNNLANFFARRFPQPDERQQLTARARFLYAEKGVDDPVEAWGRLLTEASQRRVLPALAWAAIQARQKDKNLQEVATVLGARPPADGFSWGSPLMVNTVAGAFLVGLAVVGFLALRSEKAAEDAPLLDPGLAAAALAVEAAQPGGAAPELEAEAAPVASTSTGTASFKAVAAPVAEAAAPVAAAPAVVEPSPPPAKVEPVAAALVAKEPAPVVEKAAPVVEKAPAVAKIAPPAEASLTPVALTPAPKAPPEAPAAARVDPGSFPLVAPVGTSAGRCKTKEGGFIGYWYAGEQNPGKVGQVVTMDRSANVRETYPRKDNGYNFSSQLRCSLIPGDKVRISGAPIAVEGGSYWVPLLASDFTSGGGSL